MAVGVVVYVHCMCTYVYVYFRFIYSYMLGVWLVCIIVLSWLAGFSLWASLALLHSQEWFLFVVSLVLVIMMLGWTRVTLPGSLPYYSRWVLLSFVGIVLYPLYLLLATLCLGDSDPLGVSFLTVLSGSPSLFSMRVVVHLLLVLVLLVRALSSSHYVVYVLGCLCAISVGNLIPNLLGYSYL